MKTSKLTFRFHNPNDNDTTAEYILELMMKAGREKIENKLRSLRTEQSA